MSEPLPVHGFVLAGGKSTRMGVDKALLRFCGRAMIEIAVETLRGFCAEVGIAGNRDDLAGFAPVVHEKRMDAGPGAGIEAGLMAASQPWVMFLPVDVPLVPMELLRNWAEAVIGADDGEGPVGSYLLVGGKPQPAFCLLRKECLGAWSGSLNNGERRLVWLLSEARVPGRSAVRPVEAEGFAATAEPTSVEMDFWFSNVNTPQEMMEAEAWAGDRQEKLHPVVHHRKNNNE